MKRRTVADNLGPLVDTLSNVVGILVIVLALTQIELGGALDRVLQRRAEQFEAEREFVATIPGRRAALDARSAALEARGIPSDDEGLAVAEEILEALDEFDPELGAPPEEIEARFRLLSSIRRENAETQRALDDQRVREDALRSVSKERVARLPDPRVERGLESWVLVRHGRIFPVDRKALFEAGQNALGRLLKIEESGASFRLDEFESAALYLRKRRIGSDGFRWLLEPGTPSWVRLDWPPAERGIDPTGLTTSEAWRRWLARRVPGRDFVKFHVWNDSFEAYGTARQATEAAGLGGGWIGYTADAEYRTPLKFGVRPPEQRDILVD
ncbi:MAG: hypothetical protein NXI30_27165 [bacterium]|nr:hypothetical protein [bacterium]